MDNISSPQDLFVTTKASGKIKMFIRFVVSGGAATATTILSLYILTDILNIWYLLSSATAFILGFIVSFILQKFWTFRDNFLETIHKQVFLYLLIFLVNLGLNTFLMYIMVDFFGLWYLFSQIVAGALIAIESFFIYKRYVFRNYSDLPKTALVEEEK